MDDIAAAAVDAAILFNIGNAVALADDNESNVVDIVAVDAAFDVVDDADAVVVVVVVVVDVAAAGMAPSTVQRTSASANSVPRRFMLAKLCACVCWLFRCR